MKVFEITFSNFPGLEMLLKAWLGLEKSLNFICTKSLRSQCEKFFHMMAETCKKCSRVMERKVLVFFSTQNCGNPVAFIFSPLTIFSTA